MPGIPPSGTPEAEVFWVSFWAALYSGILYSLVTGFVVALGVWSAQSLVERVRTRTQLAREIALLREELRGVVGEPDVLEISSAVKSVPPAAHKVIQIVKERPLDLWLDSAQKWKHFLHLLRRLQKSHDRFVRAAEALDFPLRQFIRRYNAARNAAAANDPAYHAFIIGRIHGKPVESLQPWIDRPLEALSTLEASFNSAIADSGVQQNTRPYLEARQELVDTVRALTNELNNSQA